MNLVLETKKEEDKTASVAGGRALLAPPVSETYWLYRVRVSKKQAVLGFLKFGTIGVGFAKEKDWNTNLPYTSDPEEIYDHIKHNRLGASKAQCLLAIQMIQEEARKDRP